jgi:hypothetical protein
MSSEILLGSAGSERVPDNAQAVLTLRDASRNVGSNTCVYSALKHIEAERHVVCSEILRRYLLTVTLFHDAVSISEVMKRQTRRRR